MKRISTFIYIPLLIAISGGCLLWAHISTSTIAAAAPTNSESASDPLSIAIDQYIQTLQVEEGFAQWHGAVWTRYPLGPGVRGWIIILEQQNEEVGYLVVYPKEDGDGFILGEYGTGNYALFSMNTLYQSLVQHELISNNISYSDFTQDYSLMDTRIYLDALYAFWRLPFGEEHFYFDAKTGEMWFVTEEQFAEIMRNYTQSTSRQIHDHLHRASDSTSDRYDQTGDTAIEYLDKTGHSTPYTVSNTIRGDVFDPFYDLSWLVKTPLEGDLYDQIRQAVLNDSEIVYAARLLDKLLMKPFAVIGMQEWRHDRIFLILEEEGQRYVPAETTFKHGSFFH